MLLAHAIGMIEKIFAEKITHPRRNDQRQYDRQDTKREDQKHVSCLLLVNFAASRTIKICQSGGGL